MLTPTRALMSNSPAFSSVQNFVQLVHPDVQIAEDAITEVRDSAGSCSLSEFRAGITRFLDHVRVSGQPMIVTQHGRGAAVVLGIEAYDKMLAELECLRDVRDAEDQIAAGSGEAQTRIETRLRGLLGR
jgi:antitoxin YefM